MKNLKEKISSLESSIKYMSGNNDEGQFDTALFKHKEALPRMKSTFRYFLGIPAREAAAEAA